MSISASRTASKTGGSQILSFSHHRETEAQKEGEMFAAKERKEHIDTSLCGRLSLRSLHCNTSESCNFARIFPDRDRSLVAAATKGGGLGRFTAASFKRSCGAPGRRAVRFACGLSAF